MTRREDPDFYIIRHENRGRAIDVAFWLEEDSRPIEEDLLKFINERRKRRKK